MHKVDQSNAKALRAKVLGLLGVILLTLPIVSGQNYGTSLQYFPDFVAGGGATTFFTVHNPTKDFEIVLLELFRADGLFSAQSLPLGPGASQTLTFGGAAGSTIVGWARL